MPTAQAQLAPELTLVELDRANLYLEQTRDGFIGTIKLLSAAQWSSKPDPTRWSSAEIAEHILKAHEHILGPIRERLAQSPAADTQPDRVDDLVIARFANRMIKATGPEALNPSGGLSRAQAIERAASNYARLKEYLRSEPGLRDHAIESIPLQILSQGVFKLMDGYQWILAAAAHTERHTKQILELIADPSFPAA